MAAKYLCPYCYKENKMSEVDFRCVNRQCKELNDELLAQYCGKKTMVKLMTFKPQKNLIGKMPQYAECTECHTTSNVRLCPQCHNILPGAIDESNDMIISIIGARDSGKSNYVGVLIHELQKRVMDKFDFAFSMINESKDEYSERFGSFLYPDEYKKGATAGTSAHTVRRTEAHVRGASVTLSPPIVCELAKEKGRKIKRYSLSFLDSAGEDFEDPAAMATVMPYIAGSKGIIFLLDPMQIPKVRNQIDESIVKSSGSTEMGEVTSHESVISNVAKLIRTKNKMRTDKKIDIPVVVAFSKFDALKGIVDSQSKLWNDSPHAKLGEFDKMDLKQVDAEMRGLLHVWNAADFIRLVETEFSNAVFLPCSAFGACPDSSGNVAPPKSLRLEDGVLWVMNELKLIPQKK